MLSLTRRVGESVLIGDDIEVYVHQIRGGQVNLMFKAPRDVVIDRLELRRAKELTRKGDQSTAR
ncbi:MAG: carbon storage regulator [Sedimenticola sp.]